jgi:DNA-binding CsgD family transcriptional regulator
VSGQVQETFGRRLAALPQETQLLLLVAAADPVGEPNLFWRAAQQLEIDFNAAAPAAEAGLAEFSERVRFRHPLVRAAVYEAASAQDRRRVHQALAEVTDPGTDPDRRAWHRAHAATGPDEEVAAELERSAGRAQARGGLAAEATFLEQAANLTVVPARRAQRCLAAAQAKHQAGAPTAALSLLSAAETGPLNAYERARANLLRAQVAAASGNKEAPTLLEAGRRLEPLDIDLARQTYLDALCATVYGGSVASGCQPVEVARRALAAARPEPPRAIDLLLDGLALKITEGYSKAAPALRRALDAFESDDVSVVEGLGWGWLACYVASTLYEHDRQYELATRHVRLAREAGALMILPNTLGQLVGIHLRNGELGTAAALMEEVEAAVSATGGHVSMHLRLSLAVFQGREAEARNLIDAIEAVGANGLGGHVVLWGSALLYNSLGRYADAMGAGLREHDDLEPVVSPAWVRPELIEAAVRCGARDVATGALERLAENTQASSTGWALGLEARARALLAEGDEAERLYREAIEHLTGAGSDVDLMRGHLLFGEWLRREGRRVDARRELRTAAEAFRAMGVQAFADRAARELLATGETVRRRSIETNDELTPQERQIAHFARDGLSNPEIGARLFLSPRTVEWHLRKVFGKLGIHSRHELESALPSAVPELDPA